MASDDKYDRQVRLWGHHGQKVLAHAHIILLGTASSGTETLKNLILPGIGKFTIVDDTMVTLRDCGNNFFVTHDDIGKPKAQVVCDLLAEMNPDCKGEAHQTSVDEFVKAQETTLCNSSLIIACDIDNKMALRLGSICETNNTPLVIIRSYGMLGYIRLYKKECCIIEGKDYSTNTRDLRVNDPFPELQALSDSFDLDSMDPGTYLHTPYVVFLMKCREKWMASHDGQMPKSFAEKKEFMLMLKSFIKYPQENNIQEALAVYTDCFRSKDLSPELQKIIDDERCDREMSDDFWLLAAALKRFYAKNGCLPVSPTIPDMVATTQTYQQVQRVYIAKAKADRDEMKEIVDVIVEERMMRLQAFPDFELRLALFCKSVSIMKMVQVLDMRSIAKEISSPIWDMSVMPAFWNENISGPCWLLCMRAFEEERVDNALFGEADQDPEQEFAALRKRVDILVDQVGAGTPVEDKYVREIVRNGKSYQHNVSSFLGGLASQESVKLMMNQYVPLNHTFVYDAINGGGSVFNI